MQTVVDEKDLALVDIQRFDADYFCITFYVKGSDKLKQILKILRETKKKLFN
jgi:hypothetical protein